MKIHTRRGLKRLFLDLHTIGGVYVCLLLLVMALTGLTWSFDWYRNGFYSLFGVKPEKKEANAPEGDKPQSTAAKGASAPMAPEESEEEFVVVPLITSYGKAFLKMCAIVKRTLQQLPLMMKKQKLLSEH